MKDKDTFFVHQATETLVYKHIYLRGNYKQEMFFDKVDMINVWNRIWLSAAATETEILAVEILGNHLHLAGRFKQQSAEISPQMIRGESRYMHHFRLSISQYHNHRYGEKGMLGSRDFGRGTLTDQTDTIDCVCYIIRNVLHHGIMSNFMDYEFSTAKLIFSLLEINPEDCYTSDTLPSNLARAYLPSPHILPKGWLMTKKGMIIPPNSVFRRDLLEDMFVSSEQYLEILSQKTSREANDEDDPSRVRTQATESFDVQVSKYVHENCRVPIPSMNPTQKMEAIKIVIESYPGVSKRLLSRLFGIPLTTLTYRLRHWYTSD